MKKKTSFDKKWEEQIYRKGKQINKYPFDSLVSSINQIYKNKKKNNLSILDLGCGAGNNVKFFLDFGFKKIVGIDGSKSVINFAKRKIRSKRCKFLCSEFDKYKFKNKYFNLVVDRGSLTHNKISFISKIIRDISKTLKPNGYLISHLFSKQHSEYLKLKKNQAFKERMSVNKQMTSSFFDIYQLKKIFKKFEIISIVHSIEKDFTKNTQQPIGM